MSRHRHPYKPSPEGHPESQVWIRSPGVLAGIVLLALGVLGGTVLWARNQLRERIREQIVSRDGAVLHAVTQMPSSWGGEQDLDAETVTNPSSQFALILTTSRLRGVLGARLYDATGAFIQAFPPNVIEDGLGVGDMDTLLELHPVSRFHAALPLDRILLLLETEPPPATAVEPILEVNIPLHQPGGRTLAGVAQFLIEGGGIQREFTRLDDHLRSQALTAFTVAGSLLACVIGLAFHRLRRSDLLVQRRTSALIDAQQEVVQTAKTSAVGAVTSHLIHELKNPLAGLHPLLQGCASGNVPDDPEVWKEAAAATGRMNTTIQEIVTLLREDQSSASYQVSLLEVGSLIRSRLAVSAEAKQVRLDVEAQGEGNLSNRAASLVVLILVNLGENAIHATPSGGSVRVRVREDVNGNAIMTVADEGSGMEPAGGDRLFRPKPSTREGGSGLGLAICKQLANHLGASLELKVNSPGGCVFELRL